MSINVQVVTPTPPEPWVWITLPTLQGVAKLSMVEATELSEALVAALVPHRVEAPLPEAREFRVGDRVRYASTNIQRGASPDEMLWYAAPEWVTLIKGA